MTETLRHWDALERTDPKYTKNFTRGGGFRGTDINPAYRMKRLTELFGPVGQGWGWIITDRWREDFGQVPVVFVAAKLWYLDKGERWETGEFIGGTEAKRTPDEAYKMAVTDAIGKCMVSLGLSADIYMGIFDGKYHPPESNDAPQPEAESVPEQQPPEPSVYERARKAIAAVWYGSPDAKEKLLEISNGIAQAEEAGLVTREEVADLTKRVLEKGKTAAETETLFAANPTR